MFPGDALAWKANFGVLLPRDSIRGYGWGGGAPGTTAQRAFTPGPNASKTDEERNKMAIPHLDSVPNIKKGNNFSSPFNFCFTMFIFGK